jgi:hypothetical protein
MANKTKEKSYWPHLILGFLIIGMTLSFWTVKSANSIPVQRVNDYMMRYQLADMNINDIKEKQALFDKSYIIAIDAKSVTVPVEHSKAKKEERAVVLRKGKNNFVYIIKDKANNLVSDMNVSFLLTRPHTTSEDARVDNVPYENGKYIIKDIDIQKPGRYIVELKAQKDDAIGYLQLPAYLAK